MLKSALEIAMEKTGGASGPALTDAQKDLLAEVDSKNRAKRAELEILMAQKLQEARLHGDEDAVNALQAEWTDEKARLDQSARRAKDRVREGLSPGE